MNKKVLGHDNDDFSWKEDVLIRVVCCARREGVSKVL